MTNTLTALATDRDAAKLADADSKFGSVMRFTRLRHTGHCTLTNSDP
jgi:hypothetical protein